LQARGEVEIVDAWKNQIWIELHNGGLVIASSNNIATKYSEYIVGDLCY
jgi:hypothetical protein